MNNKEFTSELAERLGYTIKDTSELMNSLLSSMTFCPEFRRQFASGRQRHHLFAGFRPIRGEKESGTDFNQPGKQTTHVGSTQISAIL